MSIRQGNNIIAGSGTYHPNLFDFKWSDHILNDVQWLRADTFSWQSGLVYEAAYNHLEAEILGKSLSSETISGITIQFYLADDGHKICPSSQEENVISIYNATGIAWYYIIDPTNHRFKLPRTKFGFTGIRDEVGKFVEAGLPNIKGTASSAGEDSSELGPHGTTGAFYCKQQGHVGSGTSGDATYTITLGFDASQSNSIYSDSVTTVQPQATEMYLYFFVGNFETSPINNPIDVLNLIYPVGSIYIGIQTVCPMTAIMSGSTWELVSAGKALWTGNGNNANTTINAGLPNITGSVSRNAGQDIVAFGLFNDAQGALYINKTSVPGMTSSGTLNGSNTVSLDASRSSAIYGASDTVQPPAYVVNVWKRTA